MVQEALQTELLDVELITAWLWCASLPCVLDTGAIKITDYNYNYR